MFQSIQAMRGAAAIMVVYFHYMHLVEKSPLTDHWIYGFGGSGVDIFFVISGFIMMISHDDAKKDSASGFLVRRVMRIVPLYWVLTIIAFFSALLLSPAGVTAQLGFKAFWMSMIFLPYSESYVHLDPAAAGTYVLPMAWTLAFEWYFYILFAITIVFKFSPAVRLIFLFFWFFLVAVLGYLFQPEALILQIGTNVIAFEFLLGCIIAYLYKKEFRINSIAALCFVVFGFILISVPTQSRLLLWGSGAFLLIAAASLHQRAGSYGFGLMIWFGDISYSLYLSHFFALSIFQKMQGKFLVFKSALDISSMLAFAAIALAIACVCFYGIENPARHFFARQRASARLREPLANRS